MRQKKSLAEDWVDLVALLPWKVGVALAVVSYVGLHLYVTSTMDALSPNQSGGLHLNLSPILMHTLARFLQYVIPILCLIGAVISFFRRLRQKRIYASVATKRTTAALFDMDWQRFEWLVAEYFRQHGYQVTSNHETGPDGGVDVVVHDGNDQYLVQCKQWRSNKVGVQVVRELNGLVAARGAVGGFVVSAGTFTEDAKRFAKSCNIQLIEGRQLVSLISAQSTPTHTANSETKHPQDQGNAIPSCPVCNGLMVRREAKRGKNAGEAFWGCSSYPSCKGTRRL